MTALPHCCINSYSSFALHFQMYVLKLWLQQSSLTSWHLSLYNFSFSYALHGVMVNLVAKWEMASAKSLGSNLSKRKWLIESPSSWKWKDKHWFFNAWRPKPMHYVGSKHSLNIGLFFKRKNAGGVFFQSLMTWRLTFFSRDLEQLKIIKILHESTKI